MESYNFTFDFKAKLGKNLAKFTFSLVDSEGKLIKLSNVDQKVSQLHFITDTLKMNKSKKYKLRKTILKGTKYENNRKEKEFGALQANFKNRRREKNNIKNENIQ